MSEAIFAEARIVVVDDDQLNVDFLKARLARWGYRDVISTTDSSLAVALCTQASPDLILLDLHMPPPDGFEVLELLAPLTRSGGYLPVIVLTADITEEARHRALAAGAKDFIAKPFDPVETSLRVGNLLETRRLHLQLIAQNEDLERQVRERTFELEVAREGTLERLALAAEYRDDATHQHAQRVGRTAALLAEELHVEPEQVRLIRRSAPLHDIGKIGIPEAILLKPGKLTADEFELIKSHTVIGSDILSGSPSPELRMEAPIARSHHERWDGRGYPDELSGDQIPLVGRLVAVADMFDALTHSRPYKDAWPLDQAVAEVHRLSGTHLDPAVVEAFDALDHQSLLTPIAAA